MQKRPLSLSIIAWVLIIFSVPAVLFMFFGSDNPASIAVMEDNMLPIWVQKAMMLIGSIISFVSGIAILKGKEWSRKLYIGWSIFGIVVGVITSPAKLMIVPSLIFLAVIAFFLYRPQATDYFNGVVASPETSAAEPDNQQ